MAIDSTERPTIRMGSNPEMCRIDLRRDLDEDDFVSSATVEQVGDYDLVLGTPAVGDEEAIINFKPVPAGKWVEFTVANHDADNSPYRVKLTFTTTRGIVDKSPKNDFVFDVVE